MSQSIINISRSQQLMHVQKEIQALMKDSSLNKTTEFITNESNMSDITMVIKPIEGLYKDLTIYFQLTIPNNYPAPGNPIDAKCLNDIYHPNIYSSGKLCLYYDNIGCLDSGYKETLENLVIGVNYLFLNPGNKTVTDESEFTNIVRNVNEYKLRKNTNKIGTGYKSREFYLNVNSSLSAIKNWQSFFPEHCHHNNSKSRYYMFTLDGRKIMSKAKLEDVLSQIIHDSRYEFNTVLNLAFMNSEYDQKHILTPATPLDIVLAKMKRITYPTGFTLDTVKERYIVDLNFTRWLALVHTCSVLTNIVIRSNYKFNFCCQKNSDEFHPIMVSRLDLNESKSVYELRMDQYVCQDKKTFIDNCLTIDEEPDYSNPMWVCMSFSLINMGTESANMLKDIAYRMDPSDNTSPYVTLDNNSKTGMRIVTDHELNMLIKDDDVGGEVYDIKLASKYLASTAEETGLDLSKTHLV